MKAERVEPHDQILSSECQTFCRYVFECDADAYVTRKYLEAHQLVSCLGIHESNPFDQSLIWFANQGPLFARFADSYCRVFRNGALLRRKLVLLLAIVECAPHTASLFDQPHTSSKSAFIGRLILETLVFATMALAGWVVFSLIRVLVGAEARQPISRT